MPGDVLIRAQFDDGGASSGLTHLGTAIDGLERRSASGAQGLRSMEFGLRTLAAEALGLPGPLARVAEGLLSFGGGSALVLGVAAGIGIATLAMKAMGAEAKQAAEATKALDTALARMGGHAAVLGLARQRDALQGEADALQERIANLRPFEVTSSQRERMEVHLLDLQSKIADLIDTKLLPAEAKYTEELKRQTEERKRHTEELRKQMDIQATRDNELLFGLIGRGLGGANPLGPGLGTGAPGRSLNLGFGQQPRAIGPLERGLGIDIGTEISSHPGITSGDTGADRDAAADKLSLKIGTAVARGIGQITSGVRSGGVGGAISGIGGALGSLASAGTAGAEGLSGSLASLGPIAAGVAAAGAVVSLLGGLFSSAKPAVVMIDGYSSTAITQQQQIMQALAGFLGLKIDILSAGTAGSDQTAYALGRAARLDGGMRLPPGSAVG